MTTKFYKTLLVVEDSNEDFKILQRLMRQMAVKNPVYRCVDGDETLKFLYQQESSQNPEASQRPSVILLDLNLPGVDGRDILTKLKQDSSFKEIPIVVYTTSSNPSDIELCYEKGANGYLIKPMDSQELQKLVRAFVDYWLEANTPPVAD